MEKGKLFLISAVSVLSILVLSFLLIEGSLKTLKREETVKKGVILSTKISLLVHQLQKERGRTAGFLGSNGEKFKKELLEQRKLTDEAIKELSEYLNKKFLSSLPPDAQKVFLSAVIDRLNELTKVRQEVDSLKIDLKSAINFYTSLINQLIDSVALVARHAESPQIARELLSYADFMYAKDKAGLERAVLSVVFANDKFPNYNLFTKFIGLKAQRNAFIKAFLLGAPKNVVSYYDKVVVASPSAVQVQKYENLVLSSPFQGGFSVDPNLWFQIITKKIDLMHKVETYISEDLLKRITSEEGQAKAKLTEVVVISVVTLLIILVVSFLSIQRKEG
ncbi:nitrate- and nitrite sensing domain-containing protein [Thermovibrio sp.]